VPAAARGVPGQTRPAPDASHGCCTPRERATGSAAAGRRAESLAARGLPGRQAIAAALRAGDASRGRAAKGSLLGGQGMGWRDGFAITGHVGDETRETAHAS
jgi:hypothetical protein